MSEIQFQWLHDVFDSLRANDSITTTGGRLNGLAEGSHLLGMLRKASLITITKQPGRLPSEVRKTSSFGRKRNQRLIEWLREKLPSGTRIVTHSRRKVSEIREWRRSSIYYVSTGETEGSSENMAQPKPLTPKQAAIDERERIVTLAKQVRRRGQQKFSEMIRKNYGGRCAVTECATPEVLEAAHIKTFDGQKDDHSACNGILLRADIHALLDRLLISFSDDGQGFIVSKALTDPGYEYLRNTKITNPINGPSLSKINRDTHRLRFLKNGS